MSVNHDFHLHFMSEGQVFSIDFKLQEKPSVKSALIDGKRFVLRGNEAQIAWLREKLPELDSSGLSLNHLKECLQNLGAIEVAVDDKVEGVVIPHLQNVESRKEGAWASEIKESSPYHYDKQTPIERISQEVEQKLQDTCPKGAGSIVMVSTLEEGSQIVSGGSRTVQGGKIDGQTAAIIGSGSKMLTSLCSMALIDQGVINKKTNLPLSLDTKVADVFSKEQMAIFEDQEKAAKLTLGMLLSHTSGLIYFADDNREDRSGQSLGEILLKKAPGSVKFYGNPGDQIYSYSNHIGLVAVMIELACEKPYAQVLKERVLDPLGMDRTSYDCPSDENVLLAYEAPQKGDQQTQPTSIKREVTDPMMQGAGGLWSCMDDMAKLGLALGKALSQKSDLKGRSGQVIISRKNLQKMVSPQSVNGPCGLALDLEGDVIGKGGGIFRYDFKFKVDVKTGNSVSMMCNHAGQGDFGRYLEITTDVLKGLNPQIQLPLSSKPAATPQVVKDLEVRDCTRYFKGFSGLLFLPNEFPLTRVNFNGTTLPLQQLPAEGQGVVDRYRVIGDSPFQGKEFRIYQRGEHSYPCFIDGMEVWSFGEVKNENYPIFSAQTLYARFHQAEGDYSDPQPGGPDPHQIRVDPENGITLSLPDTSPAKCLVTSYSDTEVSFRTCIGGGPQPFSFKLAKSGKTGEWFLTVFNGETEEPAGKPLVRKADFTV